MARYKIQLLSVEQPGKWIDSTVDPYSTEEAAIERAQQYPPEQHTRVWDRETGVPVWEAP